jgi:hypothetical protein
MKNDIETAKDHLLSYQRTLDDGLIGFRYSHEEAKMLVAYADQFIPKNEILKQIIARIEQYEVNRANLHSTIDDIKLILAGYKQPDK